MKPMPESVKSMWVGIPLANPGTSDRRFDIKLGCKEVIVALAIDYSWIGSPTIGTDVVAAALWRKSDTIPAGTIWDNADSPDMVWNRTEALNVVAESIRAGFADHIAFPRPIALIRPPRLWVETQVVTGVTYEARLYYLIREINDEDLAKLMVKDHA